MRIRSALVLLGAVLLSLPATTLAQNNNGPPKRFPGNIPAAALAAADPGYTSEIMPIRLGVPIELKENGDTRPPAAPPAPVSELYMKETAPTNARVRALPTPQGAPTVQGHGYPGQGYPTQGHAPPGYPPPGVPVHSVPSHGFPFQGQIPPGSEQLPPPRRLEGEPYPPAPLNYANPPMPAPMSPPMAPSHMSSSMPHGYNQGHDTDFAPAGGADCRRGPRGEFWARAEYLLWWVQDQSLPPLVTTSATQASLGRLGRPDTSVLFGGDTGGDLRQGGRFSLGYNLMSSANYDGGVNLGIDGSYFFLDNPNNGFQAFSTGDVVLARPFVNALTGLSSVEQVANLRIGSAGTIPPDISAVAGGVSVNAPSEFWGTELNANARWLTSNGNRVELLAGYRHLQLNEAVVIQENLFQLPDATGPVGDVRFIVNDGFAASNQFNGGQVGFRSQLGSGRFSLEFLGKLAVGSNRQRVAIAGNTLTTVTGGSTTLGTGGLLALPTNIGVYERDRICLVPEIGLNATYYLTPYIRCLAGYNFLYWSSVVRPGDQIDLRVNPNFIPPLVPGPGPARPSFNFNATDLWVQGINLGLEVRY